MSAADMPLMLSLYYGVAADASRSPRYAIADMRWRYIAFAMRDAAPLLAMPPRAMR